MLQNDKPHQNRFVWKNVVTVTLLLLTAVSDAFVLFKPGRSSFPHYSVADEIEAFATGRSRGDDSMSRLVQAAAAVTQESCHILGVKSVGVDYGLSRTGIAATVGYDPKPVAILSYLSTKQVSERVVEICRAEQANRVIVGLPLHKNGTEAEQTTITRLFAAELAQYVIKGLGPNVPVHLWDERYTSKEAAARAHSKDPNRHLYGTLDAEAACIILENYYHDNGKGAERVDVPNDMYEECKQIWEERRKQREESVQATQEARYERLRLKKEDMQRDRQIEMERGSQASSSSKKKKKKKLREKRGPWIVPGNEPSNLV
jgi:putative Holliday junction resolvase